MDQVLWPKLRLVLIIIFSSDFVHKFYDPQTQKSDRLPTHDNRDLLFWARAFEKFLQMFAFDSNEVPMLSSSILIEQIEFRRAQIQLYWLYCDASVGQASNKSNTAVLK